MIIFFETNNKRIIVSSVHDEIVLEYTVNLLRSEARDLRTEIYKLRNEVNDLRTQKLIVVICVHIDYHLQAGRTI